MFLDVLKGEKRLRTLSPPMGSGTGTVVNIKPAFFSNLRVPLLGENSILVDLWRLNSRRARPVNTGVPMRSMIEVIYN